MLAMSWQRPRAPLFSRVITTQALGLVLTYATSLVLARVLHAEAAYSVKATVAFAVISLVVLGQLHHHPFERFGPANVATTARGRSTPFGLASSAGSPPAPLTGAVKVMAA